MTTWHLYFIRLPVNDYAVAYVGVTKNKVTRLAWTAAWVSSSHFVHDGKQRRSKSLKRNEILDPKAKIH